MAQFFIVEQRAVHPNAGAQPNTVMIGQFLAMPNYNYPNIITPNLVHPITVPQIIPNIMAPIPAAAYPTPMMNYLNLQAGMTAMTNNYNVNHYSNCNHNIISTLANGIPSLPIMPYQVTPMPQQTSVHIPQTYTNVSSDHSGSFYGGNHTTKPSNHNQVSDIQMHVHQPQSILAQQSLLDSACILPSSALQPVSSAESFTPSVPSVSIRPPKDLKPNIIDLVRSSREKIYVTDAVQIANIRAKDTNIITNNVHHINNNNGNRNNAKNKEEMQNMNRNAINGTGSNKRRYQCSFCGKTFKQSHSLKDHIRTHTGEKPFKCDFCGKAFNVKYNMTVHRRLHTGVKPYECKICLKRYASKSGYNSHVKKQHPGLWNIQKKK